MGATAVAINKNMLHVFIGSTLKSLASPEPSPFEIGLLVCSVLFGICVFVYISRKVQRVLVEIDGEEEEVDASFLEDGVLWKGEWDSWDEFETTKE